MEKLLEKAVTDIKKRYGDGAIFKLGSDENFPKIERFSSGSITLDIALGGGYPKGRMVEIFGEESSGKSTMCSHAIAEVQKLGGVAAYIDGEHALDPNYNKSLGVDIDNLYISQPDHLEQGLTILESLVKAGVDLIVFDSTSSLPPKAELDGDFGDSHMGLAARIFSQACRKLNPLLKEHNSTIIWVSQTRQKIGIVWGSNEVIGVGNALKFYASIRLKVQRTGSNKDQGEAVSNTTKATVKKNKTYPPFKEAQFDIVFGTGIDKEAELIDLGVENQIIGKSGSWFDYTDTETGEIIKRQGKTNFQNDLPDDCYDQIENLLLTL